MIAEIGNKLYPKVPVFAQNIILSAYGLGWNRRRFGGVFSEALQQFKEREFYTASQWRDWQTVQLRRLLVHAFEYVPFYSKKYKEAGFTLSDFERFELEDLPRLPFLEKDELRQFGDSTMLSVKREKGGEFFASSGSTGTPTKIFMTPSFHQQWSAAFEARIRHWAGVNRSMSRGMIGGRRVVKEAIASAPFYRYNFIEKQTYFSAYHISRQHAPDYLQGMMRHKVDYMTGYAMSNYFLATMLDELHLEAPQMKAIITSSEKLTAPMRETFRKVYGCKTFDSYSGVEACGLISENHHGELIHSQDTGIMEVLDQNDNAVKKGESGELAATGLLNFDQPLIRYRIGDRVQLSLKNKADSGHEMPVIEEIEGRVEDKIVGKDGREMVRFHGLFIDLKDLLAAQIIQNELDNFTINIVAGEGFTHLEEALIAKRLASQLGDVNVTFRRLQEIPKNLNGKFQAVISRITHRTSYSSW